MRSTSPRKSKREHRRREQRERAQHGGNQQMNDVAADLACAERAGQRADGHDEKQQEQSAGISPGVGELPPGDRDLPRRHRGTACQMPTGGFFGAHRQE